MKKFILSTFIFLFGNILYASGSLQSEKYFENNGGLLDRVSPLLISEKHAVALSNITLDTRGQISKRSGYQILNTTGTLGGTNGFAITGGGYFSDPTNSFFSIIVGTNVYRTGNTFNGTYTNITGTTTVTASASNLAQVTSLNGYLIFCNDLDRPIKVGPTGNAVHISTGLFTTAKTCSTYGNYLVAGYTKESSIFYPSRVRWSDINNPDSFPTNNYIDVEPNDGDSIISMISFEDSVYIFKKRSIYRMVITGSDGADAFIIRPVSRNIGAWAKNSVKVIPNVGIVFLAQNTVYVLSDSGLNPIGDPIQRTLDSISRSQWGNAVASVYPKRYQYWIALSANSSNNNLILVYDYIQDAWTTYSGITANMLSQAEDSQGNNILISGDVAGNIYKQDIGTSDNPSNVETAISFSYETPDLNIRTPDVTKEFKYIYLFTVANTTTTINIDIYYDYNSAAVSSMLASSFGTSNALYDTAIYDADTYPLSRFQVNRIELNRSAKAIKFNFYGSNSDADVGIIGWTLVYSLEDFRQ